MRRTLWRRRACPFRVGGGGVRSSPRWCVLHGRVPIIDPRARASVKARSAVLAALIFPGVFARTPFIIDRRLNRAAAPTRPMEVHYHRTATAAHCVCGVRGSCVYFDGDGAGRVSAHTLSPRSTLAALPSHRIPARWSHWTGPRLFYFVLFSVSAAGRTHSHCSLTHAYAYYVHARTHLLTRTSDRLTYAYGFVHIYTFT